MKHKPRAMTCGRKPQQRAVHYKFACCHKLQAAICTDYNSELQSATLCKLLTASAPPHTPPPPSPIRRLTAVGPATGDIITAPSSDYVAAVAPPIPSPPMMLCLWATAWEGGRRQVDATSRWVHIAW